MTGIISRIIVMVCLILTVAAVTTTSGVRRNDKTPISRERHPTCSGWRVKPSPQEPGHDPWTNAPSCVKTEGGTKLCVFTDTGFHFGQGVSILAPPEVAESFVKNGLLNMSKTGIHISTTEAKYEAIHKPGLGLGLFVKRGQRYTAGDVIMVDYPTIVLPSGPVDLMNHELLSDLRWKTLLQLPATARARTRALAQSKDKFVDEVTNIFETNAFTHEKGGGVHDMIFPEAARMNHNCLPNAFTRTNQTTLAMEVIALRNIHSGEEIAHSYLDPSIPSTSQERRNKLSSDWNFSCQCTICTGHGVSESNKRRREMTKAKELLEAANGDPARILKYAEKLLTLYDREGMILPKADYYALAAYANKYLGRRRKAAEYAGMAKGHWDVVFGPESEESESMRELQRELEGR